MIRFCTMAAATLLSLTAADAAEPPRVVASIKPVHSLVTAVMQGIAEPHLIVAGGGSPHTYAMRPSDAEALENAHLVFWIGPGLETFLESSIGSLADQAVVVQLEDSPGLTKLNFREGGPFESHDQHEDHTAHAENGPDEHERKGHAAHVEGNDKDPEYHADQDEGDHSDPAESNNHADHDHDSHELGQYDLHLWLDPDNAAALIDEIEHTLSTADRERTDQYRANADQFRNTIMALAHDIDTLLAPVRGRPFIVFHDSYQYFERHFGLNAVGSVTVSPERLPGAWRLQEVREKILELGGVCVFAEPQFQPKLVAAVTDGTGANTGILDPLGSNIQDGPDLYERLMRDLAESFAECLTRSS